MSYPSVDNPLPSIAADRFRVSAYYDEGRRLTNIDVIVNQDMNLSDVGAIVEYLARVIPTSSYADAISVPMTFTTTNGSAAG